MQSNVKPLIRLKEITRAFTRGDNKLTVLDKVSIDIYEGEFIAIIGASGSGKSTLMNIIGCLDKPSGGEYFFKDQDVLSMDSDALAQLRREEFGFVFQNYHLIHASSACENVEIPAIYAGIAPDEREKRATKLLTRLGLFDRLDHRPPHLSGGQQQRVSIARALMNGGSVILADEPTGALDTHSGKEVMALLQQLSQEGHTIILITHDANVASFANRIITMQDGKVLDNPPRMISTTNDLHVKKKSFPKEEHSLFQEIMEATKMAFRSLKMNVFRTILTLLGIVIGVASVIAMLAIGDGAKHAVLERISAMGTNLLVIRPGMPNARGFGNIVSLIPEDMDAIRELDNILAVMPESKKNITSRYQNNDQMTALNATSASITVVRNWPVAQGVFFNEEDEKNYSKVAVIGQTVATALFGAKSPLGEFIIVDNVMLQVIGVMSSKGASSNGEDEDDVIFVPYTTGNLFLIGQKFLRNITVAVHDVSKIDESEQKIKALLIGRHGLEDFRVRNMASLIEDATQTQNTMTILLGSIAAISLIVGGIGVMNIMLVSVTERTKEIGIRMAMGARRRNILQQFLVEAISVSALGGFIGVVIGLSVTALVAYMGTQVYYSLLPVALAFGCAFLTGLVFGYLPAKKAANLDPVVALASE